MRRKIFIVMLIGILASTGCGNVARGGEPVISDDTPPTTSAKVAKDSLEQKQSTQIENSNTVAYPPCIMIDGTIYKDTGYVSSMIGCGNMDGEITSTVDETKLPSENNQSNFGSGYQYQGASENQIRVEIDGVKRIFRDINSEDISIPMEVLNFNAKVKEITEGGLLLVTYIDVAEGFVAMSEGDYYVSTENLRDEVKVGDIITIWFNGMVMETYPAQLGKVYRIVKL